MPDYPLPCPYLWVNSAELPFVVLDKLYSLGLEVAEGHRLGEGGHLVGHVLRLRIVKALQWTKYRLEPVWHLELHGAGVVDHGGEVRVDVERGALGSANIILLLKLD